MKLSTHEITKFRDTIRRYYKEHGRDLPWRRTRDPYCILVSEVMLQQTQVNRVLEKYPEFIKRFPDFKTLADAPLRDVLDAWQGMGYNRRAAALKKISEMVNEKHGCKLYADLDFLTSLPGVGHNTASAILAYAFNKPVVFIETNVRTVFMHFFFPDRNGVKDSEILPLVEQSLDRKNPHAWYSALMDYGTMLKKTHGSINARSAHYQKQSPFKGSGRQIRGMVLKAIVASGRVTAPEITQRLQLTVEQALKAITALQKEGLVCERHGQYTIAGDQ